MILSCRQQTPADSMIRTTKYFDTISNQPPLPPTVYRKPVRIVKAVQRSAQTPSINELKASVTTKMNSENESKSFPVSCQKEFMINTEQRRTSDYIRNLFPIPDRLKRTRSRQNSANNNSNEISKMSNDNIRQTVRGKDLK